MSTPVTCVRGKGVDCGSEGCHQTELGRHVCLASHLGHARSALEESGDNLAGDVAQTTATSTKEGHGNQVALPSGLWGRLGLDQQVHHQVQDWGKHNSEKLCFRFVSIARRRTPKSLTCFCPVNDSVDP